MLDYFMSQELPFFGLHGTTREGIEGLLRDSTPRHGRLNMGTFHEKEKSELRLYQLYGMANYTSRFARSRDDDPTNEGGVLVFNLEDEKGNNITKKYEHLLCSIGWYFSKLDTKAEYQMLMESERRDIWRAAHYFRKEEFKKAFVGITNRSSLHENIKSDERVILVYRLDFQYQLASVFDVLETR